MEDALDVIGADRRGGLESGPYAVEAPKIAAAELSRLQQQAVVAGPRRAALAGRVAAVENLVLRLSRNGLERQAAKVARPDLQNAQGDHFVVPRGHQDVVAIGVNFAVVEEFDDDD